MRIARRPAARPCRTPREFALADIIEDFLSHHPAVYLAAVVGLGVAGQWLASLLRIPSILLLLLLGFAAGQLGARPDAVLADRPQLTATDETADDMAHDAEGESLPGAGGGNRLLLALVSLSVAIILFEGGMSLRLSELTESGPAVLRLVTIGAATTWVICGTAAWLLVGLDARIAALLGAILVVTGPTVILPLLRQIRPARRIRSILKWEGIVIDPLGAVLAVLVFEVVAAVSGAESNGAGDMILLVLMGLLQTAAVGGVLGSSVALGLLQTLQRFWIADYLHSPVILASVVVAFALSNLLQPESGLLTVTIMGLILANQKHVSVRHVAEFKENLQVLLISTLFVVLASRIELEQLLALGWAGWVLVAVVIFVARPVSVFLSMLGSGLPVGEQIVLSSIAPRGIVAAAVSSVFALELMHLGQSPLNEDVAQLVPLTFLCIFGTVSVHSLLAGPLVRWLGLGMPNPQGVLIAGAEGWVLPIAKALRDEGIDVLLVDTNYSHVAEAKMQDLPAHCASILSDYVREELDLGAIGRLVAVLPNDEVNTLAAGEFVHLFGRAEVYQLAVNEPGDGRRETVRSEMRGRQLFGKGVDYDAVVGRIESGARVKRTNLSSEFDFQQFRRQHGPDAMVLFLVRGNRLLIASADGKLDPEPGDTLIWIPGLNAPAGQNSA